jgi:uncharacterized protein YdeI (YjbR/CyaY-like superfamily)
MSTYDPRVDAYIEKSAEFAKPILTHLRNLIHTACPDVVETWKWSFPNFDYKGSTMCNMAAFKQHCSFGFWKASIMEDPDGILTVTEREAMGHMGKITSLNDLPKDAVLKKYIKQAMKLNDEGIKKVSTRKVITDKEKAELKTPADFAALLKQNKALEKVFNEFSYSHRKEYIAWFDEAKTEATRAKRMTQALEWIAEGKGRNWKYQR